MLKRLEKVDAEKLGRRLESVGAALESATEEPWRRTLCSRLLRRSKRLTVAMDAAGHMYSPERLHDVRIAAKKLRYGLELASDSGVKQAAPHVRTIKRAQDLLGKLHDLQVLQTHIAAAQISGDTPRPENLAALAVLAAHVEGQCRRLHGRYLIVRSASGCAGGHSKGHRAPACAGAPAPASTEDGALEARGAARRAAGQGTDQRPRVRWPGRTVTWRRSSCI